MKRISLAPLLIALGLTLAAAAGLACSAHFKAKGTAPFDKATAQRQMQAAVEIHVRCSSDPFDWKVNGSGVLYGSKHVLTAWHVLDCKPAAVRVVQKIKDTNYRVSARIARALPTEDLALLELDEPLQARKPEIGKVPRGRICFAAAIPFRTRRCALTEYSYTSKDAGNFQHSGVTLPGNSGSGVYDSKGRLVGIVTHLLGYRYQITGGLISTLDDRRWILP